MKEFKYLIGIDPSFVTCGCSIYEPETKNLILHGGDLFSVMNFLNNSRILGKAIAVVENPNLDGTVFGSWFRFQAQIDRLQKKQIGLGELKSEYSIAMGHAQKVGKNKAAGMFIIEMLTRQDIPVLEIAPSSRHRADKDLAKAKFKGVQMLSMPTKTTAEQFNALTGYTGRSNEHSRDSATLIHGRTIQWAINQIMIQNAKRK